MAKLVGIRNDKKCKKSWSRLHKISSVFIRKTYISMPKVLTIKKIMGFLNKKKLEKLILTRADFKILKHYCDKINIHFCTAFDHHG